MSMTKGLLILRPRLTDPSGRRRRHDIYLTDKPESDRDTWPGRRKRRMSGCENSDRELGYSRRFDQ